MNVFDALSRHVNWASQRYAVAAENVANLDTPGFRAKEIAPFEIEMSASSMRLSGTSDFHMGVDKTNGFPKYDTYEQKTLDETHSSNDVSVEGEMRAVGEASRSILSSTALLKLFHRMTIAAAKG